MDFHNVHGEFYFGRGVYCGMYAMWGASEVKQETKNLILDFLALASFVAMIGGTMFFAAMWGL